MSTFATWTINPSGRWVISRRASLVMNMHSGANTAWPRLCVRTMAWNARFRFASHESYDCELRRCRVTNRGRRVRRIELTSYLEWVLAAREADVNHPAFSKLFVETQFRRDQRAIVARRRPRSSDDPQIWGLHWLVGDESSGQSPAIEYETNRVAFIGRGRTLQRPQALAATKLAGHTGAVLDPIGSLRTVLTLEPGESRACAFLLGVGQDSDVIQAMLTEFSALSDVDAELSRARASPQVRQRRDNHRCRARSPARPRRADHHSRAAFGAAVARGGPI